MTFDEFQKSGLSNVFPSPQATAKELAVDVVNRSRDIIHKKGRCVWAISGGSTVVTFYDVLLQSGKLSSDRLNHLTVCWVDERHVHHENVESNYGNAKKCFWNKFNEPNLIPVSWLPDLEQSARQYQQDLNQNNISNGTDIDIMLLGMGTDGHTASLFPNSSPKLVPGSQNIGFQVTKAGMQNRITMTYNIINKCKTIIVFAYGAEKGQTFREALARNNIKKNPILGVNFNRSIFYFDQAFNNAATN